MNKIDTILQLFQIEGKPANKVLTPMQKKIFKELVSRKNKRVHIQTSTQYGKSLVVAMACVWIACVQDEVVAVVAPSADKAKIILRYFIEHLGDSILFYSQLEARTKLERLKKEERKERIILRNGGGIYSLSVNEANMSKSMESAMGQGSKILIMDEACLIRDVTEATIFRMIGGKGKDAFYCKIGNPFYKEAPYTHFYKSSKDKRYKHINIDYKIGIKEGRYTEEFIADAKSKPLFDVLFDNKFPDGTTTDNKGFRKLIQKEIKIIEKIEKNDWSNANLGVDIGGGGDLSTYVLRLGRFAKVVGSLKSKEIMDNIPAIENIVEKYKLKWNNVSIDDTGIGNGVSSRLREKGYEVNAVVVGSTANDKELYMNKKAELCWAMRLWAEKAEIEEKIENYQSVWEQLSWYKFKVNSERRIQMQSKEDLKKENGGKSPDYGDGLMLTFYEPPFIGFI